jgi:hypothetical protein
MPAEIFRFMTIRPPQDAPGGVATAVTYPFWCEVQGSTSRPTDSVRFSAPLNYDRSRGLIVWRQTL